MKVVISSSLVVGLARLVKRLLGPRPWGYVIEKQPAVLQIRRQKVPLPCVRTVRLITEQVLRLVHLRDDVEKIGTNKQNIFGHFE